MNGWDEAHQHWSHTDHMGVEHTIDACDPVPSGCWHVVSRQGGVKISSYHHNTEDAREQVGRNGMFLARKAETPL